MNRNTVLNVISRLIKAIGGYTNVIQASVVPDTRIRADRKPVFYVIPKDGQHLPEHAVLEDYVVTVAVVVENHRDPRGENALRECNNYLEELVLMFDVIGEIEGLPLIAYVSATGSPKQFRDDPYIQIGTIDIAVSSYEGS